MFLGHLYPVFHRFQGGKGVATAAGVLFGFDAWLGLAALATWVVIAVFFRYSSLAVADRGALARRSTPGSLGLDARVVIGASPRSRAAGLAPPGKHRALAAGTESQLGAEEG